MRLIDIHSNHLQTRMSKHLSKGFKTRKSETYQKRHCTYNDAQVFIDAIKLSIWLMLINLILDGFPLWNILWTFKYRNPFKKPNCYEQNKNVSLFNFILLLFGPMKQPFSFNYFLHSFNFQFLLAFTSIFLTFIAEPLLAAQPGSL